MEVIFVLIRMKILSEKRIALSQTITSLFRFIKDGEGMSALRLTGQMRIDGLRGRYGNCTTVAIQLSR
jgi:hypothetical protein